MKLLECDRSCKVKVTKLNTKGDLKQRLISLGIIKEAEIEILAFAPAKATVEIKVGKMKLALRAEEAQTIEVQQI